jgi:TRAP-type C4-dicarboxylate transport system permease large subunit
MVLDITAMLVLVAPVVVPLGTALGLDPLHAGLLVLLALNISLLTPPAGACLFVLASVSGERIERIAAHLWPFLVADIAILALFAMAGDLALALPRAFGF